MVEGENKWAQENNRPMTSHSLLQEIGFVVSEAASQGRDELNAKEIEFVKRISQGLVNECKIQLAVIPHLLPEEISEETVNQVLEEIQQSTQY